MVDSKPYWRLINIQVPSESWRYIAKRHKLSQDEPSHTDKEIVAEAENIVELRLFLGCLIELLEQGYQYYIDFILWTPKIDLFPFLAKKGYHIKYDTPAKDQTNGDTKSA